MSCITGISELTDDRILIYANPSDGNFNVGGLDGQFSMAVITDITGKIILSKKVNGYDLVNFDLGFVDDGIYLLTLEGHGIAFHKSVLIQHR